MKTSFHRLVLSAITSLLVAGTAHAVDPLPVVASFSILADLARAVGGDSVSVTSLVGPDSDAHVFEPKPTDAKALLQSKLLLLNGLSFEPWAQKLSKSAGYKGETVVVSAGVPALKIKGETDPHAWQNPTNVMVYVKNIAKGLSKVDPVNAGTYQANADKYTLELQTLDAWAKEQISAIPVAKRKVITSHDAFGYFGIQHGVAFLAPQGMSTEIEPSAKQVAQLIRQIQREKVKAVFVENISNPKLLAQLSKDAGVTVGASLYSDALSTADKPGSTYLKMMRHNVLQLTAGMKQN